MVERGERLPVTARPLEHYRKVFPGLFDQSYTGTGLVIGSGLSEVVLHPRFIFLDMAYANIQEMVKAFLDSPINHDKLHWILPFLQYWAQLSGRALPQTEPAFGVTHDSDSLPRMRLIAGKAEPDRPLPFAFEAFDDVVSSNCILGGLDGQYDAQSVMRIIDQVLKHVSQGGAFHLFPFFVESPGSLGFYAENPEHRGYITAYEAHQQIVLSLRKEASFKILLKTTSFDQKRLPSTIKTLTIRKK